MSDYVKYKVLRKPLTSSAVDELAKRVATELEQTEDYVKDDLTWCTERAFPELFSYGECGKFMFAPTCDTFLDYVIDHEYGAEGEYGKIRDLYEGEKAKYLSVFQKVLPDTDMEDVRLIEYCFYNCCEAPDYYELKDDPFYSPV